MSATTTRILTILLLAVAVATPQPASAMTVDEYRTALVKRLDYVRGDRPVLHRNKCLHNVAQQHARRQRDVPWNKVKHLSLAGAVWGCGANTAGEVLALRPSLRPREVVRAWLNSPPHREQVLKRKYKYVGVGIVRRPKFSNYYLIVVVLGDRIDP